MPNDSGFSRATRIHFPIPTKTPSLAWVWVLLASLWLVGCEPPPPTRISLNPTTIMFTANPGGTLPAPQQVRVDYVGYAVIAGYPADESEPSWLKVTRVGSDARGATYQLSITSISPPAVSNRATVRFLTAQEDESDIKTVDLDVVYTLNADSLTLSPSELTFTATSLNPSLPAAQSVRVTESKGRNTTYSISAVYEGTPGWLTVPTSGITPQSIDLRPGTTNLPPGLYTAQVKLKPSNSPEHTTLTVRYQVTPDTLVVAPTQLVFTGVTGHSELPPAQAVQVASQSGKALGYSVSVSYEGPQGWLTVPTSGSTPQAVSIRPTTTDLPTGLHTAWLKFTPTNGQPEQTVTVSYRLGPDALMVSATQLAFTTVATQKELPPAQEVQVTSQLGKALGYSVSASYEGARDWLTVPSSATTPQTVSLRPNTTDLPTGLHTARLTFTPTQSGVPDETLVVTYQVTADQLVLSSTTQLAFDGYKGQSILPAAKSVELTAQRGQAPLSYQVEVSYSFGTPGWLTAPTSGSTPQTVSLRPNTTQLDYGTYVASVRFIPSNGQPAVQLSVRYAVSSMTFAVSSSQLDFTTISEQSALPAARTLEVTAQGQHVNYQVTARYPGGAQDWLAVPAPGATPQTVSIQPHTTALPPGQHTAVLSFIPSDGQATKDVTVTYTVTTPTLVVTPGQPTLRVDAATSEAALTSLLGLTSTGAPLDWRVTAVSASWLDNTAVSGNTKTQPGLNLMLLKNELAGLANGNYSGTVTLAYGSAVVPERQVVVPVKLTVALPVVRTVMPYVAEAGRSLSHVLRGEGFSSLRSDLPLRFGSTAASTYQVISDTEIRLEVPALPVGSHPVLADTALGLSRPGGATLHAVQTPTLAEASLPRARRPVQVIYDPLRLAVYSVDYTDGGYPMGLYRYRYVNGTWQEELYVQLDIHDAAMDVDGQSLYLTLDMSLYRLDLDDPTATPRFIRKLWNNYPLAVLNDGRVETRTTCSGMYTSLDGRRAMRVPGMCSGSGQSVETFDASGTSWQGTSLLISQPETNNTLDRTARYAVIGENIYNAQFGPVAKLGFFSTSPVFSHDARRLFAIHYNYNEYDPNWRQQTLHVFDVSGPPIGGRFPKLAETVVPGTKPNSLYGSPTILSVVTPDGRSLIKVDDGLFYVYPLPASVQ